jgi:hypothetical protein
LKIEFDKLNHIVIVTKLGPVRIPDIIEFIDGAVAIGEKHKCYNLIFNVQNAKEIGSFNELYEFHKNLIQMTNLTHDHRCAVVFSERANKPEKQFYETVGANWGQGIFKIFFKMEDGLKWLKLSK